MATLYMAQDGHYFIRGTVPEEDERRFCTWQLSGAGAMWLRHAHKIKVLNPGEEWAENISTGLLIELINRSYATTGGDGLGEAAPSINGLSENWRKISPILPPTSYPSSAPAAKISPRPIPPKKPLVPCEFCTSSVREDNLAKHIRKQHPEAGQTTHNQPTSTSLPAQSSKQAKQRHTPTESLKKPLVPCTFCPALVREDRLSRHMRKKHHVKKQNPPKKQSLVTFADRFIGRPCPLCPSTFYDHESLVEHLSMFHIGQKADDK